MVALSCLFLPVSTNVPADTTMQIYQLCLRKVSHRVAVQPAPVGWAFEFTIELSYFASLAGLGMCEFLHPLLEMPPFLVVMIEIKYSVLWHKQADKK